MAQHVYEFEPLDRTETATWHAPLLRHAQRDVKAASGPLNNPGQPERRHAVIRGDENENFPGIRQEPNDDGDDDGAALDALN